MNQSLIRTLALSGWALLAIASEPVHAQDKGETATESADVISALRAQIDALDEKIRILERKQESADETNTAEFKKIPDIRADSSGLRVTSKDKNFDFRLAGDAYRINPSLYYYYGPWGLIGEYVYSSYGFERNNNTRQGGRINSQAWSATATYVITGEDASYAGVKPLKPFSLKDGGGPGAWEVGARIGQVSIDGDAFTQVGGQRLAATGSAEEALGWGAVLNWYLNQNVKAQLSYDHTEYNGYAGGQGDRPDEDVIVGRLQVAF